MSALIIDRRDARLSLHGGALRVRTPDSDFTAPLAQIERVIVRGPATVETGLLSRLWQDGVGLMVLSGRRGDATARFHGQPHNDVRRRMAQTLAACDPTRAIEFARVCVTAKLAAQNQSLRRLARLRPAMRHGHIAFARSLETIGASLAAATSLDEVRGCEGAGARLYWAALTGAFAPALSFSGRNRRPPRDPVNVVLSLTYTIATFEAGRQAQLVGLDPMIGFLHAPSFGRESLACDMIEPLRPRIDLWVESLFRARTLRREHFTTDPEGACLIGKAGRTAFYDALGPSLDLWARWLSLAARQVVAALDHTAPAFAAGEEDLP